jgi:RNA polymerase sigma-B factor
MPSSTTRRPVRAPGATDPDPRFARYRATGDRNLRNALVEDHHWLGTHCAQRFVRKGVPREDLVQVAMVGLVKAVERFDPDLGYRFTTFAVPTITGELRRHFRDHTWALRVSRRAKEDYLRVKQVVDELHQSLGRSPAIPEIAQLAGLTVEEALAALDVGDAYRGVSLDVDDHDDDEWSAAGRFGVEEPGYAAGEARAILPRLLSALPSDRDRLIVKLRFVDEMTQSEIAGVLGLSQVHVSRLLRSSLERMRRAASSGAADATGSADPELAVA